MTLLASVIVFIHLLFILRILTRPHRQPASRIAWIVVVLALPIFGVLAYIYFGEVNIGHKRVLKLDKIIKNMPPFPPAILGDESNLKPNIPERYLSLFSIGESINGFTPVGGNSAQLPSDSNAVIDSMIADIDTAKEHVHLSFYIWLADNNGCKVVEALKRASIRGVVCRAMADNIGSRNIIHSKHWKEMKKMGIHLEILLPIGNPILRPLKGRIDLRNHRKIVIIDGNVTYCGSQNCSDAEFLTKAKFAPWVDIMMRFTGPIVTQNQYLFVSDWMMHTEENLYALLRTPIAVPKPGFTAQVIASGPTERPTAIPNMFESLLYAARHTITITTPYFIPNESLQNALCTAAFRGVKTTIVFPQNNDSWIVKAASRSYYAELLESGVKIYEYKGGLLHTKSITLDNEITLIGSANMDRRSFELNYENNILFYDSKMTKKIQERQEEYLESSMQVTFDEVGQWSFSHRLWNNTIAILGPLL